MFTGIIRAQGRVKKIEKTQKRTSMAMTVPQKFLRGVKRGDSIAVDGVCLSVIGNRRGWFSIELMPTTVARTRFRVMEPDAMVNLERSLRMGDRFDGHIVTGHVDGIGVITKCVQEGETRLLTIRPPTALLRYLPVRGSVAVNGVSMTIAQRTKTTFAISIMCMTQKETNLGSLKHGDLVNIEIDQIARYLTCAILFSTSSNKNGAMEF